MTSFQKFVSTRVLISFCRFVLPMFGALLCAPVWQQEARAQQAAHTAECCDDLKSKAIYIDYSAPEGTRPECFGRYLFNVEGDVEWGVGRGVFENIRTTTFDLPSGSRHFSNPNVATWMEYDGISVSIIVPQGRFGIDGPENYVKNAIEQLLNRQYESIREYEGAIEYQRGRLNMFQSELHSHQNESKTESRRHPRPQELNIEIREIEARIAELKSAITEIKASYKEIELGSPDATVFIAHAWIYAWFKRGDRIIQFDMPLDPGEESEAKFLAVLRRFHTRKSNEIPTEPGICLPDGFVADDGTRPSSLAMSFRYTDVPNVLYTLKLETYHTKTTWSLRPREPARVTAALLGSSYRITGRALDTKGVDVVNTFGPRDVRMGQLPGIQGGWMMRFAQPGESVFESYSVYTGFDGFVGSLALPAVAFEMRSFPKGLAPDELTTQPPPFDQSMKRYEAILSSLRLRPTQPPLSEVVEHLEVAR